MRKTWMQKLSIGMVAFFVLATARAQGDIVDTSYVEQALARGAIVWDAREASDYTEGHIPGAVNFGSVAKVFRDPNREDLPPVPEAEKIFGAAGVDLVGKEVIVYSRKGDPFAHSGLHAMQYYGAKQARVYHGGIDDWKAAGKPVTKAATTLPPVVVRLAAQDGIVLWNKDMLERVRVGGAQILDVRTPREFSGDDVRAVRGGHVPGAANIPFQQNWQDPKTAAKLAQKKVRTRDGMALKSEAELRALGFRDVKIYEPSWLGYAGMLTAPAENEVFVNVGAFNGKIAKLGSQVRSLEEELAKLKGQQR